MDIPGDGGHVRTRAVDFKFVRGKGSGREEKGGGKNFGKIRTHVGSG